MSSHLSMFVTPIHAVVSCWYWWQYSYWPSASALSRNAAVHLTFSAHNLLHSASSMTMGWPSVPPSRSLWMTGGVGSVPCGGNARGVPRAEAPQHPLRTTQSPCGPPSAVAHGQDGGRVGGGGELNGRRACLCRIRRRRGFRGGVGASCGPWRGGDWGRPGSNRDKVSHGCCREQVRSQWHLTAANGTRAVTIL